MQPNVIAIAALVVAFVAAIIALDNHATPPLAVNASNCIKVKYKVNGERVSERHCYDDLGREIVQPSIAQAR